MACAVSEDNKKLFWIATRVHSPSETPTPLAKTQGATRATASENTGDPAPVAELDPTSS